MHRAQEVVKYMPKTTRIQFANNYLFSLLNDGAPPMFNTSTNMNLKMHQINMVCTRWAQGNLRFKQSCKHLCKIVSKKDSENEFYEAWVKLIHTIMLTQEP